MVDDWHAPRPIAAKQRYGPLQAGFQFDLAHGYQVLTGANNSGKSTLLQLTFVQWLQDRLGDHDDVVLLLPDRTHIFGPNETGGRTLQPYNVELQTALRSGPLPFEQQAPPYRNELFRLLMSHADFIRQVQALNEYLAALRLPTLVVGQRFVMNFRNLAAYAQGSGMRSLLTILASLTDSHLNLICLDEPELSLEPRIQKGLRDLLMEEVRRRPSLTILVATHSHLFLNRRDPTANFVMANDGESCTVDKLSTREALYDITFKLLGNDTEDLFFPGKLLGHGGGLRSSYLREGAGTSRRSPRPIEGPCRGWHSRGSEQSQRRCFVTDAPSYTRFPVRSKGRCFDRSPVARGAASSSEASRRSG